MSTGTSREPHLLTCALVTLHAASSKTRRRGRQGLAAAVLARPRQQDAAGQAPGRVCWQRGTRCGASRLGKILIQLLTLTLNRSVDADLCSGHASCCVPDRGARLLQRYGISPAWQHARHVQVLRVCAALQGLMQQRLEQHLQTSLMCHICPGSSQQQMTSEPSGTAAPIQHIHMSALHSCLPMPTICLEASLYSHVRRCCHMN